MGKRNGLVKECALECIGGGDVAPSYISQTLGQAMCQKTHCLALLEMCMDLYVSVLVGNVWENAIHG